jgi:hypothetical protein
MVILSCLPLWGPQTEVKRKCSRTMIPVFVSFGKHLKVLGPNEGAIEKDSLTFFTQNAMFKLHVQKKKRKRSENAPKPPVSSHIQLMPQVYDLDRICGAYA